MPNLQAIREDNRHSRFVGIVYALLVVALFAGLALVSRLGFATSLGVLDIAAIRFGIGGLCMLPVLAVGDGERVSLKEAAILTFLGGMGFALFAYTGFSLAPAAHGAVLLHGTLPLWTFLLILVAPFSGMKRANPRGIAAITVGIALMAWDSVGTGSLSQLVGDICFLLAALCWSGYGIYARRMSVDPSHAAAIVAVSAMIIFIPIYLTFGDISIFRTIAPGDLAVQVAFHGVMIGALSVFIYTKAVSALGAVKTAMTAASVPCIVATASIPFLGESPTPIAWTGVAVVTVGLIVGLRSKPNQ